MNARIYFKPMLYYKTKYLDLIKENGYEDDSKEEDEVIHLEM